MVNLDIIGTNHYYENGPTMLAETLRTIKPDLVLVEGTEADADHKVRFVRYLGEELRARGVGDRIVDAVLKPLRIAGYEVTTSIEYFSGDSERVVFLNDICSSALVTDEQSDRFHAIKRAKEIARSELSYESHCRNNDLLQAQMIELDHSLRGIVDTPSEKDYTAKEIDRSDSEPIPRGHMMEKTLREAIAVKGDVNIATVTGFLHILDDQENRNFYGLIRDLNPTRHFLI